MERRDLRRLAAMKKIYVIGGMGAGKSTARKVLAEQGVPFIDLDKVGHEVLEWDTVKDDLVDAFGADIIGPDGKVVRSKVAAKAFATPAETRKLNRISMPRIEESLTDKLDELRKEGHKAVVVEYSVFKNRQTSMANGADVVLAVLAPLEDRIKRAVAAGWEEDDVRRRIERQISDADRIEQADVVFNNDSTQEALAEQVVAWWKEYEKTLE
jgi:dephospho-CoA kinase